MPSPRKRSVHGGGDSDADRLDQYDALEFQKSISLVTTNPAGAIRLCDCHRPSAARPAAGAVCKKDHLAHSSV
jgi:hypothetical protein